MRIIEIAALGSGAHRNQSIALGKPYIPDGWAIIPDGLEMENFPFGELTVEEINGVPTVIGWTPGVMPAPAPEPEPQPVRTAQDDTDAMLIDHEYRITLMELGLNEE